MKVVGILYYDSTTHDGIQHEVCHIQSIQVCLNTWYPKFDGQSMYVLVKLLVYGCNHNAFAVRFQLP